MKYILIMLLFCSCSSKYPQDNIVEEIAEDVLEHETGLDVDFSPNTPERPKVITK